MAAITSAPRCTIPIVNTCPRLATKVLRNRSTLAEVGVDRLQPIPPLWDTVTRKGTIASGASCRLPNLRVRVLLAFVTTPIPGLTGRALVVVE